MPRPEHQYILDDKVRNERVVLTTGLFPRLEFLAEGALKLVGRAKAASMLCRLRELGHYAKWKGEVNTLAVKRIKN